MYKDFSDWLKEVRAVIKQKVYHVSLKLAKHLLIWPLWAQASH